MGLNANRFKSHLEQAYAILDYSIRNVLKLGCEEANLVRVTLELKLLAS